MKAGRELDALVAEKVMGKNLKRRVWPDGSISTAKVKRSLVPHYSTSIADAWQVVEKLVADHWEPAIDFEKQRGQWCAEFSDGTIIMRCFADTAPLAICKAALMAVGVEVESPK